MAGAAEAAAVIAAGVFCAAVVAVLMVEVVALAIALHVAGRGQDRWVNELPREGRKADRQHEQQGLVAERRHGFGLQWNCAPGGHARG